MIFFSTLVLADLASAAPLPKRIGIPLLYGWFVHPVIAIALGGTAILAAAEILEELMSSTDPTYVIFDGDNDKWAYAFMLGWRKNERIDFDFRDSHDIGNMTARAQDEAYVKSELRKRMDKSKQVVVILGDNTKNLYRYIRWEIELAIYKNLPIIIANLNGEMSIDADLCPAILRDHCAVHVPFKLKAIKHALDNWPSEYARMDQQTKSGGARHYGTQVYEQLGL